MKHEIYLDVTVNGHLSKEKLYEQLNSYSQRADNTVTTLLKQDVLKGDALADSFFNHVDEETVLSIESDTQFIHLKLGRYYAESCRENEKDEFGTCYLLEVRNLKEELQEVDDFELGQEEKLIAELKRRGL